jgi:hypothetical protein
MPKVQDRPPFEETRKSFSRLKKLVREIHRGECTLTAPEIARAFNADVELAKSARVDEFTDLIAALMVVATEAKLFPGDTTQADISDVAYIVIREAAWRLADASSFEEADSIARAAVEVAEIDLGSLRADQRNLNHDIEVMSGLLYKHLIGLFGIAAAKEIYEGYDKLVSSMLQVSCRAAASFALRVMPAEEVIATLESILEALKRDPQTVGIMPPDEHAAARPCRSRNRAG